MSGVDQFSLRWNNFYSNLSSGFHDLLREEQLVDVTLATEGKIIKAHQVVLSVCSPFFRKIFQINPCKHPVVILNINYHELRDILTFVYQGEVNVRQEDLAGFLKAAELLQIKGLTGDDQNQSSNSKAQNTPKVQQVEQNTSDYKTTETFTIKNEEIQQTHVKRPQSLPKLPNHVPIVKKKRPSYKPNQYDFKALNQSPFLIENSADSTSEQRYYTTNVLDLKSNVPDSNNDENSMKSQIESAAEDMSDSENFRIKSEMIEMDDCSKLESNNSSNLDNLTIQDKENDNIREDQVYFHCSLCSKKFVNRYNLKIHMRDKHSPAKQESLTCELCGKTMRNESCLRVHKYNHRKQTQILNYSIA